MAGVKAERFHAVEVEVLAVNERTQMVRLRSTKTQRTTWMRMDAVEDTTLLTVGSVQTIRVETWMLVANGWSVR